MDNNKTSSKQLSQPLLDEQREPFNNADGWEDQLNTMYKGDKDNKDAKEEDDSIQIIDLQIRVQSSEIKKANEVDFIEVIRDLKYNNYIVYSVFIYVFILNIMVNLDHGAMPAALIDISNDVQFTNQQMGTLGSLVFFGLFIGTLNASFLMYRLSFKKIIIGTLFLNGIALYLFTVKSNYYCMCISRFISGFSQIFITIYVPLYVDAFSSQKQKIFLLSMGMLCPTIGVVFGYGMTSYIITRGGVWETVYKAYWWQSFRIQTWLNWITAALGIFIPDKYLSVDDAVQQKRQYLNQLKEEQKEKFNQAEVGGTAYTFSPQQKVEEHQQVETGQEGNEFSISDVSNSVDIKKMSDIQSMIMLSKNHPYMFMTLGNCVLFFIVSGMQYWVTFYFVKCLGVPSSKGPLYFSIVVLSAPIAGALLSGPYSNYWGGIYSRNIAKAILFLMGPAIISALPIPFINSALGTMVLFWFLLFFGSMILPILTGVILTKVEPEMRPRANSIANLFYELLGYFPAPVAYGYACQLEGSPNSRAGMALLMFSSLMMPVFISLALFAERKAELEKKKLDNVINETNDEI